MAERLSLSPKTISSTATASFSLIIGIAPYSKVFSNAFIRFSLHSSLSTSLLVIRNCPTVWPNSANILSYININSHWPIVAAACLPAVLVGLSRSPNLPTPTPIAPEVTSATSTPELTISEITATSFLICLILLFPVWWVNVDVPTLITILFTFFNVAIISPVFYSIHLGTLITLHHKHFYFKTSIFICKLNQR